MPGMPRKRRDIKGQMQLPFGQEPKKRVKKIGPRKGPSLAERRAAKDRALRLCNQAYAVLKSRPVVAHGRDVHYHLREIGLFIGECKKGRLTYAKAQAAIGAATSILDQAGVKYRL